MQSFIFSGDELLCVITKNIIIDNSPVSITEAYLYDELNKKTLKLVLKLVGKKNSLVNHFSLCSNINTGKLKL